MESKKFIDSFNKIKYSSIEKEILFDKIINRKIPRINTKRLSSILAFSLFALILNTYPNANKTDSYMLESSYAARTSVENIAYKSVDDTVMTSDCINTDNDSLFANQMGSYGTLSNTDYNSNILNNYNINCN